MAMPIVQERLRAAAYAVPKPWVAFALAAGLWAVVYALGAESLQVLTLLRS